MEAARDPNIIKGYCFAAVLRQAALLFSRMRTRKTNQCNNRVKYQQYAKSKDALRKCKFAVMPAKLTHATLLYPFDELDIYCQCRVAAAKLPFKPFCRQGVCDRENCVPLPGDPRPDLPTISLKDVRLDRGEDVWYDVVIC